MLERARLVIRRLGLVLLFALVAAAVVYGTFHRQLGLRRGLTVWAEDGQVFSQCALDQSPLTCLTTPYQGYLHVVPRIGADLAVMGSAQDIPERLTLVAAVAAAIAAGFAALAVAEATGLLLAGLVAGGSLVLVYPAAREISGNLTNVHSMLLAACVAIVAMSWLGRRARVWDLVLIALTAVTSPFGALLAVLAVVPLLRRQPGARVTFAVAALASVPQVLAIITAVRTPPPAPLTLQTVVDGFEALLTGAWFGPAAALPNLLVPAMLVAALAIQAWALWSSRAAATPPHNEDVAAETPGTGRLAIELATSAVIVGAGLAIWLVSVVINHSANPRYQYDPGVLTVIALTLATALAAGRVVPPLLRSRTLPTRRQALRLVPLAVVVVVLGLGFAKTFRIHTRESAGPNTADQIKTAAAQCQAGASTITVDLAPPTGTWHLQIPCSKVQVPSTGGSVAPGPSAAPSSASPSG